MPKIRSSPTLHDVARRAGVSYQTVSRVINNLPNVAPDTLERVQRAIAELNYRPNRAARSLVTGRSHALHVLACDKYNFSLIPSMEEIAYRSGYQLRLTALHQTHSVLELRQKLTDIVAGQVDGVVIVLPWQQVTYAELLQIADGVPLVIVGSSMGENTNSVVIDQQRGTRLAIEHLLELGHRRLAEICGTIEMYEDAEIRHQTFLDVLRERSLPPGPCEAGNFTMDRGYAAMQALLARRADEPFSAVFCANDETALGAMHAIHDAGLRVPDDISITGFDDAPFARHCVPPLTTVRQDNDALGSHAIQRLLTLIEQPDAAPQPQVIVPSLIIRESTAPPRDEQESR